MKLTVELLKELVPLVIFVIVAISSALANMKNKKRQDQDQGHESPQPAAPAPRPRERRVVERSESLSDEMRKTLEDIFETKERQPATASTAAAARPASRARADDSEWTRSVREREAKNAVREAAKDAAKAAARDAQRTAAPPPKSRTAWTDGGTPATAAAQARSGVVWAEILGPPVSMR